MQITGGGVNKEGGAGEDPPAAAEGHLGDGGGETGAGEGEEGQGQRPAGRHAAAGAPGEREAGGAGAVSGTLRGTGPSVLNQLSSVAPIG